ncbi:hypothetical protein E1298_06680, partial [Actinomadura rubrisoli]
DLHEPYRRQRQTCIRDSWCAAHGVTPPPGSFIDDLGRNWVDEWPRYVASMAPVAGGPVPGAPPPGTPGGHYQGPPSGQHGAGAGY